MRGVDAAARGAADHGWIRRAAIAAGTAATVVALGWSIAKDVPHSWSLLRQQHAEFAGYTRTQRDEAYGALLPLTMSYFEWYREYLRPGDRYWVQVPPSGFGEFMDLPTAVRRVAHLILLPAVEARDPRHATVVLSWNDDPGLLHLHYSEQARLGQQLFFVSRVDRGG